MQLNVKIVKINPLKESSYIELPEQYRNPNYGLINIRNNDTECFKWSVDKYFCMDKRNPQRITKKLREEAQKLSFVNIKFPMAVNKIYILKKIIKYLSIFTVLMIN